VSRAFVMTEEAGMTTTEAPAVRSEAIATRAGRSGTPGSGRPTDQGAEACEECSHLV